MSIDRIELQPGYSISRVIKGGWHLAGGHGSIAESTAISDMKSFVEAGVTTFDCADIYTGVEELIGKFLLKYKAHFKSGELQPIQIHTKYVPDYSSLSSLTFEDTQKVIDRSLMRLGVERLDLVQFSWWDYQFEHYVETANYLKRLQEAGKIRYIGLTNFDGPHVDEIVKSGVKVASNQVQYSLLDQRVERCSNAIMEKHEIKYLCYGVVAGGFLSDRYLNVPDPKQPLENRSLVKYRLIIEEFGGYDQFQEALGVVKTIANKHNVGISEVVSRYILEKKYVAAAIIGARNTKHLDKYSQLFGFSLDEEDQSAIADIIAHAEGPRGSFYELERDKTGKHGSIMKYNLNTD
jgi:aryl-alcohol dehydrogenase-like predicted oxidoreductase